MWGKTSPRLLTGGIGRMKKFEAIAWSKWNNYNVVLKKRNIVFCKSQRKNVRREIQYNSN